MILAWERHPSVTYGGKAYFYSAYVDGPNGRICYYVVWDRLEESYAVQVNGITQTYAEELKNAKRAAERLASGE